MNIAVFLQAVASVAWLAAIGALGWLVFSIARGRRVGGPGTALGVATVLAIATTTVSAGLVFIGPTQRAVVVTPLIAGGLRPAALQPGLHWIVPFVEQSIVYDISRRTYTMSSVSGEGSIIGDDSIEARTDDGQEVKIDASVLYSIDPSRVIELHTTWQDRVQDEVVRPLARGIIREVVSQYGVEEIVSTQRDEMAAEMRRLFIERLGANSMILQDFVLRNITFTEQYAEAVEQKQIAEQQAQQAAFVVEQRRQEAEQARALAQGQADAAIIAAEGRAQSNLIEAEAQAEALRLISAALKDNPDLLTYRYIERLAPNVQVMYLPANQPYLLALPDAATSAPPAVTPTQPEPTP